MSGRAPLPRLHAVTDEQVARREDVGAIAGALARGAGTQLALHARGRGLSGLEHYRLASCFSGFAPAQLFVNDRLDVALACGAAGVQLTAASLAPPDARLLHALWWIGCSVHDFTEAKAAREAGADYLVLGPVFDTATHPGRKPIEEEVLRKVVALGLPVIAIGGVTPGRVDALRRCGVYGIAAVGALWNSVDPGAAARVMLERLTDE